MSFRAVEEVTDNAQAATYVNEQLTQRFEEVHMEITEGFDPRDVLTENKEGEDMDMVIRESVKSYGEPEYTTKRSNVKKEVDEATTDLPFRLHELAIKVKFRKKELKQAAKLGRDVNGRKLMIAKDALRIAVVKDQISGVSALGMPGMISDASKFVHDQLSADLLSTSDSDLEDYINGIIELMYEEIGSEYPIQDVIMSPKWNTRLCRSFGDNKGQTFKEYLSKMLNIPAERWHITQHLKQSGLGASYSGKDTIIFVPNNPRIVESLSPVRFAFYEPYKDGDGDLTVECYAQHGGVAIYEKLGALANGQ